MRLVDFLIERSSARLSVEALALVAVAVGGALAQLPSPVLLGSIATGWLLLALVELAFGRGDTRAGRYYVPRAFPAQAELFRPELPLEALARPRVSQPARQHLAA